MNIQRTTITMLLLVLALFNTGCSTSDTNKETAESDQVETSNVEIEESTNTATNNFIEYTNASQSFSIEYPADWTVTEGESFGAFNVFIGDDEGNSLGILPNGELDFGLPQTQPEIEEKTISTKKAEIKRWNLENNEVLVIVKFIEFPSNWSDQNRIQFSGTDEETFEEMLQSFEFTD